MPFPQAAPSFNLVILHCIPRGPSPQSQQARRVALGSRFVALVAFIQASGHIGGFPIPFHSSTTLHAVCTLAICCLCFGHLERMSWHIRGPTVVQARHQCTSCLITEQQSCSLTRTVTIIVVIIVIIVIVIIFVVVIIIIIIIIIIVTV